MVGIADAADVARAAEGAARAQKEWAALPHPARAAVLRRAGQLWEEYADEISGWNIREVGAIPPLAGFALHVTAAECYEAAALPSAPLGSILSSEEPRLSLAQQIPVGVVGVISPFNVPLILGIRAVAPALALGNAVLLKPDPRTVITGGVSMVRIFEEAGLPAGLLQLVPGGAEVGEAMVADPRVRVIAFTGSTRAGRAVGELAGRHLTRAHLELGGNSAYIIRADADVDKAVNLATWGSFLHQGQICMTVGRHIVHESLFDEYVDKLAAKADSMHVGDPAAGQVHLGPLIDEVQRDRVHTLVQDAVAQGAELRAGGTYEGLFYRPTVLANTAAGCRGVRRRGVRAGGIGRVVLDRRRGRRAGGGHGIRARARHRHGGCVRRSRDGAAHPHGHRAHQRPDRERRGQRPVRRRRLVGDRLPPRRRAGQHRRVHRDALDHDAPRAGAYPL